VFIDFEDESRCVSRIFYNTELALVIIDSAVEIVLIDAFSTG
jgi:hypothetical protein